MSDIETKVVDSSNEHVFHQDYSKHKDCSACWSEKLYARERRASAMEQLGSSPASYRVDFSSWNNNPLG